jgi:hypothetical protein
VIAQRVRIGKYNRLHTSSTLIGMPLSAMQIAYILAVNANIIADSGGPCSSADCTVRL